MSQKKAVPNLAFSGETLPRVQESNEDQLEPIRPQTAYIAGRALCEDKDSQQQIVI